jgi:hypothetical protein
LVFNAVQFGLLPSDVVGFTPDQRTSPELQLTVSIVNEASWLYKNFKLPRFRNSYGYAQLMSGAYVVEQIQLQFLNQEIVHWRDLSYGVNVATGCFVKGAVNALEPGAVYNVTVVKTRQRFTSVRFRLYPGIEANVGIAWETPSPVCGESINEPDALQGEPQSPNNRNADPGSRPVGQGGDNSDRSANDGDYNPDDGLPPPPFAGDGDSAPCWHAILILSVPPNCSSFGSVEDFEDATDQQTTPVYSVDRQSACPNTTGGDISYGGAVLSTPRDVVSCTFSFY